MYMTVKQAAEKWGIPDRRVRILCAEGKISGATRDGLIWMIPTDAKNRRMDGLNQWKIR